MKSEKKNVVLDTNIIISAFISPFGAPARVFELFLDGTIINYTSEEIIDELKEVICREKFIDYIEHWDKQFMLDKFKKLSLIIKPKFDEKVILEDLSDDKFINCALTSKSNIISGDSHLLRLKIYKGVKIMSAKEFLKKLKC